MELESNHMSREAVEGWTEGPSPRREGGPFPLKHVIARAHAAWEGDDYASALADFEGVLARHPDFPDIRNWAGLCRAMLGDPEGALGEFEHALRVNPEYAAAHLNRALVLSELGRLEEAGAAFQRVRELDAGEEGAIPAELGNRIASTHATLGDLYIEADRPEQAVEEYRKALAVRPGFVDIRTRMAQAWVALGQLEEARDALEVVLAERPSFLEARVRLGAVLKALGGREEAIAEWRRCLEIDPTDRRVRAYLASVGVTLEEVHVRSPVPPPDAGEGVG